jgi:putative NADH-flavin reductase
MKILIFGATGGTGRLLVEQALSLGHLVTAFVRNPAALTSRNKNLNVLVGDVLNQKDVEKAVKNQDVVISALGNKTSNAIWKSNTIISDGVRNIISAMQKEKVKRFLFIASFGVNKNIFFPEKLFIRIILRNIFADIPKQEKLIKESGLDWTIVHPARLVNTPWTGKYKMGEDLSIGLSSKIARADVADFLLKTINSKTSINKTVTISY